MNPRVVLLAGLAVLAVGCLVEPGEVPGDPDLDTQSSALDTAGPLPPSGDPALPGAANEAPNGPPIPATPHPGEAVAEDPSKPSPDPWKLLTKSPAPNTGVAVSPTTSKTGSK